MLIVFAVAMLPLVYPFIARYRLVGFACNQGGPEGRILPTTEATRMTYCISFFPRNAVGMGQTLDYGTSDKDQMTWHPPLLRFWLGQLRIERDGETLVVNGHVLDAENYDRFRWFPSINPWLLTTARVSISNKGKYVGSTDCLYLLGRVEEGWLPSPVGLVLLGIGIWLFRTGRDSS